MLLCEHQYSNTFLRHRHCCIIYKIYTFFMIPGDIDHLKIRHKQNRSMYFCYTVWAGVRSCFCNSIFFIESKLWFLFPAVLFLVIANAES